MKESIATDSMVLQLEKNTQVTRNTDVKINEIKNFDSNFFTALQEHVKRIISLHNYEGYFAWLEYVVLTARDSDQKGEAILITACKGSGPQIRYLLQQLLMHSWETGAHVAFVQSNDELFKATGFINYKNSFVIDGLNKEEGMMAMELSWEGLKKVEGKKWLAEK